VVGEDRICDDLAAQIRRRLALKQRGKPIGVFLFAGPPGSGKTWLGKVLAEALGRRLLHFDMTQYSAGGFGASSLFGSARGYVGSQSYGALTAALRDTPDAVVLLDEIEKAHGDVHKKFLTAWNDGFVTETSDGKQIPTTRSIFVLTTNAAVDTLSELSKQYANEPDTLRSGAVSALRNAGFAPEVLNRIDRIFVFEPLSGLDIARVAALEIERMIAGYGLTVAEGGIDPQVLLDLMSRQKKIGSTASSRDLTRAIEESIADSLIAAKEKGAISVSLIWREDGVVAEAPARAAGIGAERS
jgi:ATP-dependent Clp protease ATP-binding subunit ClpA